MFYLRIDYESANFEIQANCYQEQWTKLLEMLYTFKIPHKTKHMVRRAPAVKIVTKICSFVTIVQGTFLLLNTLEIFFMKIEIKWKKPVQ